MAMQRTVHPHHRKLGIIIALFRVSTRPIHSPSCNCEYSAEGIIVHAVQSHYAPTSIFNATNVEYCGLEFSSGARIWHRPALLFYPHRDRQKKIMNVILPFLSRSLVPVMLLLAPSALALPAARSPVAAKTTQIPKHHVFFFCGKNAHRWSNFHIIYLLNGLL